jgi:hypothetical protein
MHEPMQEVLPGIDDEPLQHGVNRYAAGIVEGKESYIAKTI